MRGGVIKRAGEARETKGGHVSRREFAGRCSCQWHDDKQGKSSARERLAGASGRIAHQLLQELWFKYSRSIQHAADQDHEETTDSEILVLEQPQIHDWILRPPLPPDQANHPYDKQHAEDANEAGGKPVVLFPLVEHDLQPTHGDTQ